jgi:predicted nucleic-acid-binding protein
MPSTHVVDANVILRYLLADHEEHSQHAAKFMADVKTGTQTIYIPESVVAECVYVLSKVYKVPRDEIADSLRALLNYKGVSEENRSLLRTALYRFVEQNVDFVDALVFGIALEKGWQIFSFDNDMKKMKKNSD